MRFKELMRSAKRSTPDPFGGAHEKGRESSFGNQYRYPQESEVAEEQVDALDSRPLPVDAVYVHSLGCRIAGRQRDMTYCHGDSLHFGQKTGCNRRSHVATWNWGQ
jgi:hypothetical protein